MNKVAKSELAIAFENNPIEVLTVMVLQSGKEAIKANAKDLKLEIEAKVNGKKYKITSVTTYKEIK